MSAPSNPSVSLRKTPKQARANALIEAVLEAAIQVLAEEGAARFTTARVAERAGVSVGSLYQYFPNKAAILFRLQKDEWEQTTRMFKDILGDETKPFMQRLRELVYYFIQSECDESETRGALDDAAPLYRDAPELHEIMREGDIIFKRFMDEMLPNVSKNTRKIAGDVIIDSLTSFGESFSDKPRTYAEIKTYSNAMADMFCAYIKTLNPN